MRYRWLIPLGVALLLFLYTGFKTSKLFPKRQRLIIWVLTAVFFILTLSWQIIFRTEALPADSTGFLILAWSGSITLGLWATFLLIAIPADLIGLGVRGVTKVFKPAPMDPARRELFSKWAPTALLVTAGGITGLGLRQVMAGPEIKDVSILLAGLPDELVGVRIAQISDLHVGPTIRKEYVEEVVRKVMSLDPDLIAVTGDLVDGTVEILDQHVAPLAGLKAPLGTYYVTGNHEYYWGAESWIQKTRELGFTPLLNENRILPYRGRRILVGGVTDTSADRFIDSHQSDPQRAITSGEPTDFKLLLAHRPDSCIKAEPAGFDLQISGHTHAGQFFPWNLLVSLAHRYYRGLNRHGRMWVYVNAGTGYWGPPHRFAVPSEITLYRLSKAAES